MTFKVLIVDDDKIELEEFKNSINWESLGFDVTAIAINGQIGYQQYLKFSPDLIITDIEMPGMSGIEYRLYFRRS